MWAKAETYLGSCYEVSDLGDYDIGLKAHCIVT
jgi:hypothetical protein